MRDVDALFILGASIWWVHYLRKIWEHAHQPEFLKMPWLYMWSSTYVVGLTLLLSNVFVRTRLHEVLAETALAPVGDLLQCTLWLGFQWVAYRVTRRYLPALKGQYLHWVSLIYVIVVCANPLLYVQHGFQAVYWFNNVALFIMMLIPLISVPRVAPDDLTASDEVQLAHTVWVVVYFSVWHLERCLHFVIGWRGLSGLDPSRLNDLATLATLLAFLAAAIMTSSDRLLYATLYPLRWWRYTRLRRLSTHLTQHSATPALYQPLQISALRDLDLAIYQTVIAILDQYRNLPAGSTLRAHLQQIEQQHRDYDVMVGHLVGVARQL